MVSAATASRAARIGGFGNAHVLRETVRVFCDEGEHKRAVLCFRCVDRKLRDGAIFVFDFNGQFITAQNARGAVENVGEFSRRQSVVGVIGHPRLQQTGIHFAHGAAAIHECLVNASDFRDVRVNGNQSAVWQKKAKCRVGILAEMFLEFSDGHGVSGEVEQAQQSRSRTTQQAGMASSAPSTGATTSTHKAVT